MVSIVQAFSAMSNLYSTDIQSPVGILRIHANDEGITAVEFVDAVADEGASSGDHPLLAECARQLDEYFAGTRSDFSLDLSAGGTEFERQVWSELVKIPFGKRCSYLDIAERLGNPNAVRAVGLANGRNPIAIIVPCHRVVGSDGSLTGYAGGLWRKQWLLEHEGGDGQIRLEF
jgi:methylated-DNA-[protein]-cysteine S-methyltransferase